MRESTALLAAVCENPDDVVARFAYADWLDEHGDMERAEFIRVQLALASPGADPEDLWRIAEREQELRKRLRRQLGVGLPGKSDPVYRGGFLAGLTLTVPQFRQRAAKLFAQHPLTRVCLKSEYERSSFPGGFCISRTWNCSPPLRICRGCDRWSLSAANSGLLARRYWHELPSSTTFEN
jgi:uncharacterized protein (TIGR02996 family)